MNVQISFFYSTILNKSTQDSKLTIISFRWKNNIGSGTRKEDIVKINYV